MKQSECEALLSLVYDIRHELRQIRRELYHQPITRFHITEVTMLPIAPGFSPVFTATPTPAGTAPGAGLVPAWTSSDSVNAPVSADSTGLVATVAIPASAVVGTTFTLTVSLTNADGTVATGTLSQTIVSAPSPDVQGFTIAQTA